MYPRSKIQLPTKVPLEVIQSLINAGKVGQKAPNNISVVREGVLKDCGTDFFLQVK
jgi:sRNA-binding carbon storage regulator CsrA